MYETLKAIFHTRDPGTVLFSAIAFVFFAGLIWNLTGILNDAKDKPASKSANRLVAMIGALCGWIIGIAFAPFSDAERTQFAAISSVVSAFLSGYVVSKIDRFVEGTLFPVNAESRESWSRVGLFASALLLASVTVFVNRLYAFQDSAGQAVSTATAAASAASAAKATSTSGAASSAVKTESQSNGTSGTASKTVTVTKPKS